ncbi:MAG: EscU/YscU/HrcU family type III secretion system export apparatus switch protein [Pseudolabrys sp.]|nr:EscU/YscU/HrcU family type III secretion system export apparatus switch protein [Pseudolabrys sp.]MCW5686223.1 EscU/YscU/HrcU family type III secretion system export apparatus switch protein [Pseudolabrys sp.]
MTEPPKSQSPEVAVALQYERPAAPRVVAIGRGDVAKRIADTARAHGVPLNENPTLAVALSQLPLDEPIPESLYRAVAEVLGYILRTTGALR